MIHLQFSAKYKELFTTYARYIHLLGGRGRGGSYTATLYALKLLTCPQYFRGYFLREIFGDIRESLWRDLKDRIEEHDELGIEYFDVNESSMTIAYPPTGNVIISKGFKKSSGNRTAKLKSLAGATHVFIEEADEIAEEDFNQLDDSLRTIKAEIQIIMVFNNPPKNHWINKRWYTLIDSGVTGFYIAVPKKSPSLLSIQSTYLDNLAYINESTVARWEEYKETNPDHYYTIIKGLVSEGVRGRIYKNWKIIQSMPNLYNKFYGLDWGYSGDPLALVECEVHNRTLYIKEVIYKHGLTNDDLERELMRCKIDKRAPIVADSAQPKDIEDMKRRSWNFQGARKGTGSVKSGIAFIKQYEVYLTEDSVNIWKEVENYAWALDQYKEPTNEPIDKWNHSLDALNYAMDRVRTPGGISILSTAMKKVGNGRSEYNM